MSNKTMIQHVLAKVPGAHRLRKALRGHHGNRNTVLRMMPQDSVSAEIGVWKGGFSARILPMVRPRRLHLIDPWKHEPAEAYRKALYGGRQDDGQAGMDAVYESVLARFRREIEAGRVVVHRGSSAEVAAEFDDGYFDWVYIDGNHTYEFVRSDLETYSDKVKAGGFIAGDDYGDGGWWEGGVKKAVDEFVGRGKAEFVGIYQRQFLLKK